MRAVVCSQFGPPETLVVEQVPARSPRPGEVLVRVEAAGVNFPDTLIIQGKYQVRPEPPFSPGSEVAGTVESVGEGVTELQPGDPVIGMVMLGAFAEQVAVPAKLLMRRPAAMDAVIGAGFTMTYGTSLHALRQRAALQPGETLLVLGASGGVGLAAVEIGKIIGATVIAAASTLEKLEVARAAGADHLVDYTAGSLKDQVKDITRGNGVDVAFDPVGGNLLEEALRATGWGGRVLVVGFASGTIPRIPANLPLLKGSSLVGVHFGPFYKNFPEMTRQNFDELFAWHEQGRLKPLISRTMDLADAAAALEMLASRKAVGKIVLTTRGGAA
jgi:NADPH2:quinone reductase